MSLGSLTMNTELVSVIFGGAFGLAGGIIANYISYKKKAIDQKIEDQKLWVSTYDKLLRTADDRIPATVENY